MESTIQVPERLRTRTLGEVSYLLQQDSITHEEAEAYVQAWNTSTIRFTEAFIIGHQISQWVKP